MGEFRDADSAASSLSPVVGVVILAAAVAIPYVADRSYRRWLMKSDLLAGLRDGLRILRADYLDKRANLSDIAVILGGAVHEGGWVISSRSR